MNDVVKRSENQLAITLGHLVTIPSTTSKHHSFLNHEDYQHLKNLTQKTYTLCHRYQVLLQSWSTPTLKQTQIAQEIIDILTPLNSLLSAAITPNSQPKALLANFETDSGTLLHNLDLNLFKQNLFPKTNRAKRAEKFAIPSVLKGFAFFTTAVLLGMIALYFFPPLFLIPTLSYIGSLLLIQAGVLLGLSLSFPLNRYAKEKTTKLIDNFIEDCQTLKTELTAQDLVTKRSLLEQCRNEVAQLEQRALTKPKTIHDPKREAGSSLPVSSPLPQFRSDSKNGDGNSDVGDALGSETQPLLSLTSSL